MIYRLGLDVGGTKINIGILRQEEDGSATVAALRNLKVKSVSNVTEEIKAVVEELCKECEISAGDIVSCGVGIPGTVSSDGKRILKAPNIAILSEDFADKLSETLNLPVLMLQDSRAAAWGEYTCGGGKGTDTLICITLGTGIGTGMVIDGKIYNGALGAAGEMGHVPVVPNGRLCGCGKRGCMEKYCAGGGLDITASLLLGEGKTSRDLFEAARNGHSEAKKAIDEAIVTLGNTIVTAVNLLSPNAVLFSGGMSKEDDFLNPLIEYVRTHCYSSGELPRLERAALGELAPLVGAAFACK